MNFDYSCLFKQFREFSSKDLDEVTRFVKNIVNNIFKAKVNPFECYVRYFLHDASGSDLQDLAEI